MSYAAGIDNNQIGLFRPAPVRREPTLNRCGIDLVESELFEQLSNLLAFVLIDFAAKGFNGKSFHNMV